MNNTWLFLGPELGIKKKEIDKIKTQYIKGVPRGEEIERINMFASDNDVASIAFEIKTTSLFSAYRIISVKQIELWSSSDAKSILDALHSKDSNTLIILTSEETKVTATLEKTVPTSQKKTFWSLTEHEYVEYVRKTSKAMKLDIQHEAIEQIVYLSGENTQELDTILSNIKIFCTVQKEQEHNNQYHLITKDDIELWVSHQKQESVFKLFAELSHKNYIHTMSTFYALIKSGEHPNQMIAGLIYQIKNALRLKQKIIAGSSEKSALLSLFIRNFEVQKQYINFVRPCSLPTLQRMLEACFSIEETLRSGGDTHYMEIIMSKFLYTICMLHKDPDYQGITEISKSQYNKINIHLYDW